ncbi:hypothetical protein B0H19DRAFT_1072080 [Mycena capillaripes]|nr:hypothetical protein B0H19DRAFT_1072080 [Mycena capillaripes]
MGLRQGKVFEFEWSVCGELDISIIVGVTVELVTSPGALRANPVIPESNGLVSRGQEVLNCNIDIDKAGGTPFVANLVAEIASREQGAHLSACPKSLPPPGKLVPHDRDVPTAGVSPRKRITIVEEEDIMEPPTTKDVEMAPGAGLECVRIFLTTRIRNQESGSATRSGYRHIDTITIDDHPTYVPRQESHVAGDRNKYKGPILKELTEHLNDRIVVGGLKKLNGVKQKLADSTNTLTEFSLLPILVDGIGHFERERELWQPFPARENIDEAKAKATPAVLRAWYTAVAGRERGYSWTAMEVKKTAPFRGGEILLREVGNKILRGREDREQGFRLWEHGLPAENGKVRATREVCVPGRVFETSNTDGPRVSIAQLKLL